MKTCIKLAVLALTGLVAAAPMTTGTLAADAKDAVAKASAAAVAKDKQILQTADEAYTALRKVRAARVAIFNGTPDIAGTLVSEAVKELLAADNSSKSFAVDTKKSKGSGDSYVPFDISMSLAEGFVATEAKAAKLKEANSYIAKGNHKKAAEVLKLAKIDVTVAAALIPVKASVGHAKDAEKLIGEKKYYEANLALKAIEDSIIVDSFDIQDVPEQGTKG